MSKPELYAVAGRPAAHSLSPDIFRLFFAAAGLDGVYLRLAADSAREAVETARAIGLRGLNVTSPFKEEMISLVDAKDEAAARIGAVNCVKLDGRSSTGYNTDFIGLIGTLRSYGVSPSGRAALVLGAGGAARAAAYGLVGAGAARVILAGRSPEKAEAAARALGCDWAPLADAGKILDDVDICVSCLPFPASRILGGPSSKGCLVVDAHYASVPEARQAGYPDPPAAHRWLFHQAVPSFEILTGLAVSEKARQKTFEQFSTRRVRPKRHLALVGFMGTGKTTTGRELARLTGWEFVDTDESITAAAGLTVPQIFALRGESAFRSHEASVIKKTITPAGRPQVIAVGGGAVLDEANRRTLAENCRVIWLWAPARTAVSRIEAATRPVLDPGGPLESADRTLAARLPLYAAVSDLIVNAAVGSPLDVARRIKDEMDQTL